MIDDHRVGAALGLRPLAGIRPECKGQAGRTVGCLNRSFLPLRTFTDLDDLHVQHDAYRGGGLGRYHRRVGARCFGRRPRH